MTINEHDETYHGLLKDVLENGELVTTRAVLPSTGRPVGAYTVFGRQVRYDLRKGFPLLTTKKVSFKAIAVELLWFLSGDTNIKFLKDNGVNIWDEWADKDGNLGPMYGYQLRNLQKIELVAKKTKQKPAIQRYETGFPKEVIVNYTESTETDILGKTYTSATGDYTVIKGYRVSRNDETGATRQAYDVQFHQTGFVASGATKVSAINGQIKDRFSPTVEGVGCLGVGYTERDRELLYQTWVGMLNRCYDPNHIGYQNYGGKGVFVEERWLCFANFASDCKKLSNWLLRLEYPKEYTLDKDYYGANYYGPDTTIWLSKAEQNVNQEDSIWFRATGPQGEVVETIGVKTMSSAFGFKPIGVHNTLNNKQETHHGWKFERLHTDNKEILPRARRIDQIKKIIAELKHDPNSRRIMASTWGVADIDDMALNPCHGMPIHFKITDDGTRLNCHVYQRSGDLFLGVPYNIASYALLTHMIAQVCGLEVGEYIHSFGDLHIYENHIEQVREQLSRESFAAPMLEIDPAIKDIDDFKLEHLKLLNYESHPAIKAEVAV